MILTTAELNALVRGAVSVEHTDIPHVKEL